MMIQKITLSICCGTYCHIMGGAEIQWPEDYLSPGLLKHVEISYTTCLGHCKHNGQKPPYAQINGMVVSEATREKIIKYLNQMMGGLENDIE